MRFGVGADKVNKVCAVRIKNGAAPKLAPKKSRSNAPPGDAPAASAPVDARCSGWRRTAQGASPSWWSSPWWTLPHAWTGEIAGFGMSFLKKIIARSQRINIQNYILNIWKAVWGNVCVAKFTSVQKLGGGESQFLPKFRRACYPLPYLGPRYTGEDAVERRGFPSCKKLQKICLR